MTDMNHWLWEIQGRLTAVERDTAADRAALASLRETVSSLAKPRQRRPDWRQIKDTLWMRAVILGTLLAGNVTLIEAVKIAFK